MTILKRKERNLNMKDRYHKKANVLGIDVSVMRVDKAVNVSMELMRGK